MKTAQDGRQK